MDTDVRVKMQIERAVEALTELEGLAADPDTHAEMLKAYRTVERFAGRIGSTLMAAKKAWAEAADMMAAHPPEQMSFDNVIDEAEDVVAQAEAEGAPEWAAATALSTPEWAAATALSTPDPNPKGSETEEEEDNPEPAPGDAAPDDGPEVPEPATAGVA